MSIDDSFEKLVNDYCPTAEHLCITEGKAPPQLPIGGLNGTWLEVQIFIYHSEYELAWDTLHQLGINGEFGQLFWTKLAELAREMNDADREKIAMDLLRR